MFLAGMLIWISQLPLLEIEAPCNKLFNWDEICLQWNAQLLNIQSDGLWELCISN